MSAKLSTKYRNVKFYGPCIVKKNVRIGEGTGIGEYCVISEHVNIGKNCRILYHVTICKESFIGDNVFIGPNTTLLNDKYPPTKHSSAPIIERDAIIGGGCLILPSVIICKRAVIGAGSVVTKSVPQGEVWFGNPARYQYTRKEYDRKRTLKSLEKLGYV